MAFLLGGGAFGGIGGFGGAGALPGARPPFLRELFDFLGHEVDLLYFGAMIYIVLVGISTTILLEFFLFSITHAVELFRSVNAVLDMAYAPSSFAPGGGAVVRGARVARGGGRMTDELRPTTGTYNLRGTGAGGSTVFRDTTRPLTLHRSGSDLSENFDTTVVDATSQVLDVEKPLSDASGGETLAEEVAVEAPLSDASVDALDLEQAVRLLVAENSGSSSTTVKRTLGAVRRMTARRLRGRDLEEADRPKLIKTLSELYQVGGPAKNKKPRFVDEVPRICSFCGSSSCGGDLGERITADGF